MQAALARVPKKELYDRAYRIKRAVQASIQQSELEPEQWTKPSEVRWTIEDLARRC